MKLEIYGESKNEEKVAKLRLSNLVGFAVGGIFVGCELSDGSRNDYLLKINCDGTFSRIHLYQSTTEFGFKGERKSSGLVLIKESESRSEIPDPVRSQEHRGCSC